MRVQDYNSAEEEENEKTNISKTNQSEGDISMPESKARKESDNNNYYSQVHPESSQWLINLLAVVAVVAIVLAVVAFIMATVCVVVVIVDQKHSKIVNQPIVYLSDDGQNVSNNSLRIELEDILTTLHDLKQSLQKLTDRVTVHEASMQENIRYLEAKLRNTTKLLTNISDHLISVTDNHSDQLTQIHNSIASLQTSISTRVSEIRETIAEQGQALSGIKQRIESVEQDGYDLENRIAILESSGDTTLRPLNLVTLFSLIVILCSIN